MKRYPLIDITRGVAVIWMVLFHIYYALLYIFNVSFLRVVEPQFIFFGKISAFLFISIAWVSFALAEEKYKNKVLWKYIKKSITIGLYAMAITFFTVLYMPSESIYFWILHFFAISFFLLTFLRYLKFFNIFLIVWILASSYFLYIQTTSLWLIPLGWHADDFFSADYFPLIPNFAYILWGYLVWLILLKKNAMSFFSLIHENTFSQSLSYIWKHSLLVYLIHMPIIVFSLWCIFALRW